MNTRYRCNGTVTVEGVVVNCSTGGEEGHGEIDMAEAMAQSCNCYFALLGQDVGCNTILSLATQMGLGSKCFDNFPGESVGNIPAAEETYDSDITNISVGQGKILVTPLQMMRVTNVIATGGIMVNPTLTFSEKSDESQRVISEENAKIIDNMLEDVMKKGTGKGEWVLPVNGKTGTVEAVCEGNEIKNCFFSGYFTWEGKTYVVTVLIEDGVSGATDAIPVFQTIHNYFAGVL